MQDYTYKCSLCLGAGVGAEDWDLLPEAAGLRLLRPLLRLLGPQQPRQGTQCLYGCLTLEVVFTIHLFWVTI